MSLTLGVVALGLASPSETLAADPVPVAQWTLDESTGLSAADTTGNGHTGSVSGATWIEDGHHHGALSFDGADDVVTIASSVDLEPQGFTISLWARADDPTEGAAILTKGVRGCGPGTYGLYVTGDGFEVRIRDFHRNTVETLATTGYVDDVWDGRWHHLSASWGSAGWLSAYADTRGVHRQPFVSWLDYTGMTDASLTLGGRLSVEGCDSASFAGDLDDVRIYDRVLDQQQLAAMEPPIPTAITLQTRTLRAWITTCVTAVVEPAPRSGRVEIYELDGDGAETLVGQDSTSWCSYPEPDPPLGTYKIPVRFERAGIHRLRAKFVPGLPWQPSSSSIVEQIVDRVPTTTSVTPRPTLPGDPINILVEVSANDGTMTGNVTLFETTSGEAVEIETKALARRPDTGSGYGSATFTLPGRSNGTYSFGARYPGTEDLLEPSTGRSSLVVDNGITSAGPVTINGGAAATSDDSVQVSLPATGAVRVRLSNNGVGWLENSYAPTIQWRITDRYDEADGLKTVHVQWQDDAGRWIPEQSDSIILDRVGATGVVEIEEGAGYTTTANVQVNVPATDDRTGVTQVQLSNSGSSSPSAWATYAYAPALAWSLTNSAYGGTTGNGMKSVHVRWRDGAGNWSASRDTIVLDNARPSSRAPSQTLATNSVLGASSIPIKVTWSAVDPAPGAGIGRYALHQRTYSFSTGSWSQWSGVPLPAATSLSITRQLAPGHSYQFRASAWDRAGNWSGWAYGPAFQLSAYQEGSTAIAYRGTWRAAAGSGAYGGTVKYSTATGATAAVTFTGRAVALVSTRGPARGKVALYVNGLYQSTVDLYAPSWRPREIVYAKAFSWSARRVLTIRVTGTRNMRSTSARVDLDAATVIR
jgi:hypothetical protein